jgi:hypothetical protein
MSGVRLKFRLLCVALAFTALLNIALDVLLQRYHRNIVLLLAASKQQQEQNDALLTALGQLAASDALLRRACGSVQ